MNKEELEQLKSTVKQWLFHTGSLDPTNYANELKLKFIEPREKRIAELEKEISVLLSCKNCPENKGGFICVKEYENKCLAQKIQYIKELREEKENLKKTYRKQRNKRIDELQKANAEQTKDITNAIPLLEKATVISDLLNKADDLIKWFVWYFREGSPNLVPYKHKVEEAEQFLKDCEVEK